MAIRLAFRNVRPRKNDYFILKRYVHDLHHDVPSDFIYFLNSFASVLFRPFLFVVFYRLIHVAQI